MKTPEAIVWLIFVFSPLTSAILTGYEQKQKSFTEDRRFGCEWKGGTNEGLRCTCTEEAEEMNITQNSIDGYSTSFIEIIGCKKVKFSTNSIADMRSLRNIDLKNVESLHFEKSSLSWCMYCEEMLVDERYDLTIPSLSVNIINCNISELSLSTFKGRINTIHFENVFIDTIHPFAFNGLRQTRSIILKNVEFKNIEEQPFKRFTTMSLELNGVKAQLIPSRFLNNVTVIDTFKITNCVFDVVRPGGFIVFNPLKFEVTGTKINHLEGEAFKLTMRGNVVFKNNTFDVINDGAFRGIDLNKEETSIDGTITFDSNVFTNLTRNSLSINEGFRPKFTNLNINESCDCKNIDRNIKEAEFYSEIKCLFEDRFITVENYMSNMCSIIQRYSTVIVIIGVVFTLCVVIITVLVVYFKKLYRSRKYGDDKNSNKGNLSLIVPDGRTYKETELHVIVERADLLTTDL